MSEQFAGMQFDRNENLKCVKRPISSTSVYTHLTRLHWGKIDELNFRISSVN